MSMADRIRAKIETGLSPKRLAIFDDSHRHAGHAGAREGGETHFRLEIVSSAFAGKSRIERQRVNQFWRLFFGDQSSFASS